MLRVLARDDYPAIAALISRHGMRPVEEPTWWTLSAGTTVLNRPQGWQPGWVIEHEGKVVGHLGNMPQTYQLDGRRLLAAAAHALVVEPEHRASALMLAARFFAQPGVDLLLNTSANEPAGHLFAALGALPVPCSAKDDVYFWVTGHAGFVRAWLKRSGYEHLSAAAGIPGLALRISDRIRGPLLPAGFPGLELKPLTVFDARFDALDYSQTGTEPGRLHLVRSSGSLQSWFGSALYAGKVWGLALEDHDRMLGYILCQTEAADPNHGLRKVRVLDFQTREPGMVSALLKGAVEGARARKADVLEVAGCNGFRHRLVAGLAPHSRRLATRPYYYKARDAGLSRRLTDPEVWDLGLIDGDASL